MFLKLGEYVVFQYLVWNILFFLLIEAAYLRQNLESLVIHAGLQPSQLFFLDIYILLCTRTKTLKSLILFNYFMLCFFRSNFLYLVGTST